MRAELTTPYHWKTGTMAENKLEGFEDFDNLLGEGEQGSEGGEFSNELDDLLGGEGDAEPEAEAGGGGGGDSELDSFFEDLSTIDDLEVLQDEEEPPPEEPAAPAAAAAPEPRREQRAAPKRERAPREPRKRGFFGRLVRWVILLGILAGIAYALYWFFFPSFEVPWQVEEPPPRMEPAPPPQPEPPAPEPEPKAMRRPPPPPPEPEPEPKPKPAPKPRAAAKPAPQRGPWHIQVATCFFDSCVADYRAYLQSRGRKVTLRTKTASTEALEIYSSSAFADRESAQAMADRINAEHPLEGHAYAYQENGSWRLSMGAFPDLARANVVRDSLNQQFAGDVMFATRLKAFPYHLRSVLTGGYATRNQAEAELQALRQQNERFNDAFVTRQ